MFKIPKYIEPDFTQEKFVKAPDVVLAAAPVDIGGRWLLAEDSRMDCVPVYEAGKIFVREFRNVKKGDRVVLGRTENCEDGIYVHADCFEKEARGQAGAFAFRQSRSRETGFSYDYKQLIQLLKHEREHDGYILWVLGPACSFDAQARECFASLVENGYVSALLAGNALATHDLEGGYLGTALGMDIRTQESYPRINTYGSIPAFIEGENIKDGIIRACVENNVPFVLNGSIRDDGPLPEVYEHTYDGQDTIRSHVRKATTVIGMATVLHTIATGNMTPTYRVLSDGTIRPVYFYMVDTSEFAANKLGDRGSLSAKGIVTNVQDFMMNVCKGLGL